jgi:hypothetical protein
MSFFGLPWQPWLLLTVLGEVIVTSHVCGDGVNSRGSLPNKMRLTSNTKPLVLGVLQENVSHKTCIIF